jgi:hypothetical protein
MALKVMEEGNRGVVNGLGYESRKTPSLGG